MNSREKGKRGERQWRDELRANGYEARRGQQFSGSPESPDVICDGLPWIHFEVKAVEKLNVQDAIDQARRDAGRLATGGHKIPVVAHKRNFREWLVTMTAEVFFRFLRGDFCATPERSPRDRTETFGTAEGPANNNQQKERVETNEDKEQ
jgi:Holliday junction resolvase